MNHSHLTWLKGTIGTIPPFFALLFHIDSVWAPVQLCLGAVVPTLMGISLLLDIKKKWRENLEVDRQNKIKEARKDYFRRKHYAKKRKMVDGTADNPTTDIVQ